jgi:two-component system sensor histidine kinase ChiS
MVLKNLPVSGVFALKKTNIRFSSRIFVNGQSVIEDGNPAANEADYRSGNIPLIGLFSSDKGDVEIIIQVSNFDYVNGGIPVSLSFGEEAAMMEVQQKSTAREFSTVAILGTLALIFFICFGAASLYRKQDYSLLVFATICLLFAIYHGLIGERSLLLFFPKLSFIVLYKVKDISSISCFIVLAIFFYQMHKSIISLKFTQAITIVLGSFIILVAILPIRSYTVIYPYVIILYELMLIWMLCRVATLYIRSAEVNRIKLLLMFMAILAINLYSIDIILFALSIKENLWLGQFYIVAFNIIMIVLIVLRFFEAYHTIDEMKNQLIGLDKIKDEFLSNTSHELKTPLNAIVNITATLLDGVEGPVNEKQAQNLAIVIGSGRRLTHMVNELLDYSKMKYGDITLYKSNLDLKAVVDSVIGIHSFLLGEKSILLVNRVASNFPMVNADGNRLIQIFHNLVDNAIKFTEQGEIEISARVIQEWVEVRVADTGLGISPDMQERIFKAFEQVDEAEIHSHGGTGLGLSITKKLVELHGGNIAVESTVEKGSVFIFTLPRWDKAVKPISRPTLKAAHSYKELSFSHGSYPLYIKGEINEPILVVDDDFANLQSMINLFKLEKYSIVVVNRGQMALEELAKNTDFFLVVLDITMPDISGYEVLQKIRERFTPFELPVLMLTAKNRVSDMKMSMDNGANDYVGKPFEAEELMARVKSLTRLRASVKTAKDAEIAFLRSQIKPHFLYNALNSIAELCVEEPEKAEELTLQLSQYLRSSFDFKQLDSLTSLENELELVEAYINIEKARFGARLNVEYDVRVNTDYRIPPLILQPLVENAIRHGLMSNLRGGTVIISVKELENSVISFIVEDNGSGMSEHKLKKVMQSDVDKRGVGLWNISQRIKLLYGKNIHIQSAEGLGTTVSFEIPIQQLKRMGG